VGLYGRDLPDRPSLASALLAVAETPRVERVRLSSIEANEVNEDLVAAMAHPRICAHLHIPLQSGDPDVLKRMNRAYMPEDFLRAVQLARSRLRLPAITTDVMVGFPGESDVQFEHTLALCGAARFSRIHVFPFSPRPGTAAAKMSGQVPTKVIQDRGRRLRELAKELAVEWADGFVGATKRVLFETCSAAGCLTGYTDRYVRLAARGTPDLLGHAARVVCTERRGGSLIGRVLGSVE
jgi:threonylcarbamoyladenosine tRNA methylthiotransferase MtaB